MSRIEFSSADGSPFIRIGTMVTPEMAAKLSPGELDGEYRSHHPGDDDRLQLFEVQAPAGAAFNAHSHDEDEIILVVDGELHAGSHVVRSGGTMYVTGGTVYAFRAGPDGLRFFNFRPRRDSTYRTPADARGRGHEAAGVNPYVDASHDLAGRDPAMAALVAEVGPCDISRNRKRRPHFAELARMICYQQLAGAAARTIHGRFEALFDGVPTPDAVIAISDDELRSVGLSRAKAASIRDLAERVDAGEVRLARIGRLPDDEVVRELTLVKGIGRWTAEMFLMFQLFRMDVWPIDDLGVRKGYSLLYGMPGMPAPRDLEPLGEAFRPYRSVAAWYCWRAVDTVIPD